MIDTLVQRFAFGAVTASDISSGFRGDVWELVLYAGPMVKFVLLILLFLSVVSWGIIFMKFRLVRAAIRESELFLGIFWETSQLSKIYQEAKDLQNSPLAEIFRSGYMELEKFRKLQNQSVKNPAQQPSAGELIAPPLMGIGTVRRALEQASTSELTRLEKNLTFLATTGNTAPFIGLFGTVWGIMDAFRKIGVKGAPSLATVAPGISEALIATAAGLFAAIPAVVAYNYYLNKIKMLSSEMENFSSEFLNIIQRYFEATLKAQQ
jgi:biopolymer transport protein TolQ